MSKKWLPTSFVPHHLFDLPRDTSQMIIAGPKTHRRASRKVLSNKKERELNNWGGNRQNIDKPMRKIHIADKGYKLINEDQSGADALIVAHLAKRGRYRELFENGIKPHAYLALMNYPTELAKHFNADYIRTAILAPIAELPTLTFWGDLNKLIKSTDDWEPTKRFYYFGKKTGHAGNYGMKAWKLLTTICEETQGEIVLPTKEAERWLDNYHTKLFPEIEGSFQARVQDSVKRTKTLRNLFNWPLNITEKILESSDFWNKMYAWQAQSTVAAITLQAYVNLQEYIEYNDKDWHILQETHDSITFQAPEKEAEEAARILKNFIEIELISPVDGIKFRMKSEAQWGYNWSNYHKDKNPEGLRELVL